MMACLRPIDVLDYRSSYAHGVLNSEESTCKGMLANAYLHKVSILQITVLHMCVCMSCRLFISHAQCTQCLNENGQVPILQITVLHIFCKECPPCLILNVYKVCMKYACIPSQMCSTYLLHLIILQCQATPPPLP